MPSTQVSCVSAAVCLFQADGVAVLARPVVEYLGEWVNDTTNLCFVAVCTTTVQADGVVVLAGLVVE